MKVQPVPGVSTQGNHTITPTVPLAAAAAGAGAGAGAGANVIAVNKAEPMFEIEKTTSYPMLSDARLQEFLRDKPDSISRIKQVIMRYVRINKNSQPGGLSDHETRVIRIKQILTDAGFDVSKLSS